MQITEWIVLPDTGSVVVPAAGGSHSQTKDRSGEGARELLAGHRG